MAARIIVLSNDIKLRAIFTECLENHPLCEILLFATSAGQLSQTLNPSGRNVILIDTETQRITDTYLAMLKEKYKLLVIIFGTANVANYMKYGFTDIMNKPPPNNAFSANIFKRGLIAKIEYFVVGGKTAFNKTDAAAVQSRPQPRPSDPTSIGQQFYMPDATVDTRQKIIAIAASTGGTDAILAVLREMPQTVPPILIVQHMPAGFTKQFAERLDRHCKFAVREAQNGDYLKKGLALLAPGDYHMRLVKKGSILAVECVQTAHVHAVRPAADVLFQSITPIMGGNVIGIILTGMGSDGARGLLGLKAKGAKVVGQNEETCVVYGMPKAAFDIGAVDYQVPLEKVAETVMGLV